MPPKRRPEEEAAFLQQNSYPSAGLAMIDPNLFTSYHTNIGNPAGNGLPVPTASQQQQQQAASSLKKKRIPACDLCNQKKIKCDGNQGCANCLKSGAACTYERNKDSRMATKRKKTDATAATVATAPLQFQQTMGMPMRPPQQQLGMPGGMMGQGSSSGMSVGLPRQQQLPQQLPQQNYQQHHQHSSMIPPRSSSNIGTTEAGIVPSGATANNTPPPATIPLIGGSMFNPPSGTQATNSSSNLNNTNTLLSAVAPRLSSSTSSNNPFNNTPTSIMLPPGTATSLLPIEQSHQSFIQQSGKSNPLSSIPKEVLDELIDLYFEFIDPAIPIIHKSSFMESRNSESPLLLNAMYALAARYSNHPSILSLGSMFGGPVTSLDEVKQRACDVFYFKARDLVDQYMDFAKVSTIAAFLLLKSLCAASGRISASWMYSGMAISMLKEMRRGSNSDDNALTSESDASLDWLEREKRRRLWWMCYVGDRFAAAASDRPMIMQDADCKVHFPASNEDWVAGFPAIPDNPATVEEKKRQIVDFSSSSAFIPNLSSQTYHGYYILLSKIYGQIIEFTKVYKTTGGLSEMVAAVAASTNTNLLLPGASAASAAASTTRSQVIDQTDLQLSLLETSLKSWHAFLPESYRALNYDALLSAPNANRKEIYIRANLQIYYRLCLIFLHKPKLMNLLRTTPPLRHHATIPKTTSFITCQQAALEITQILNMIRGPDGESGPNPQLTHFYPFAPCFAIFQSALVHLMAGQVACGAGMSGVQKATVHAIALKGLSRCWGLAGKLHSSLVGLIDVARESAMSGGDVVPCGDHCLDAVPASSGIGRGPSASATTAAPPSTAIPNPRVGNAAASSASTMHGLNSMLGLGLHSGFGSFGGMGGFMMPGSGIRVGRAESSANAPGQARIEEVFDTDAVGGGTGIIPANASVGNMSSMNGGAMSRPNLNNMWGFNADLNGGSGGSSFSPSAGGGVSSSSNTLNGNLTQGSAARHSTTANQQFQPPQQQQPQHQQHGQQRNQQPNQQQPQQLQQQMPFYNQQQNQILDGNSGANPNPNNPNMISIENNPMWNLLNSPFGDFNSANGFL